jgi:hypothetical protein
MRLIDLSLKIPERGATMKDTLVVYTYWSSRHPQQPHVGYGIRKHSNDQGFLGLALSGGIFGLFATFGFSVPLLSCVVAAMVVVPMLRQVDAAWYEVDDEGNAVSLIGRTPPKYIQGRLGVPLHTFRKQVHILASC